MNDPLQLLALLTCLWHSSVAVTVVTTRGPVHGFHVDNGRTGLFYGKGDVFLGIPFAQPPVGDLRFRLPRPICSYGPDGINATLYAPTCPSDKLFETGYPATNPRNEDCLYLNVITPAAKHGAKRPVIVWIHGGAFERGGAFSYEHNGVIRQYASRGIVVVVLQYRLGVLGFFTTNTPEFPANRALYDQIMALRWVQEEIVSFGGDPDRVTLTGQSAGAISVSVLTLSPLAKGLFNQVIQHSGAGSIAIDFLDSPMINPSKHQADLLCNFTSSEWAAGDYTDLVDCLRDMPWERFVSQYMGVGSLGMGYSIIVDGVLLPDTPSKLAKARPNYPIIIGDVRDEAMGFFGVPPDAPDKPSDLSRFNPSFLSRYIAAQYPFLASNISLLNDFIVRTYAAGHPPADDDGLGWLKLADQAITDMIISMSVRREANWHLANGNQDVYLFTWEHRPFLTSPNISIHGWTPIPHSSDIVYIWLCNYFFEPMMAANRITPDDIAIADFVANTWSNFAKHGRPTKNAKNWPAVSGLDAMEFYHIRAPKGYVDQHYRKKSHVLFNSGLPAITGEFPVETMSNAARQWLEQNYIPAIRAEYMQSFCHQNATTDGASDVSIKAF